MTDYIPLYIDGRRDTRRRYISPSGNIVSYRTYIKHTYGQSPEEKAYQRYKEGKAPRGKTVQKIEERKRRKSERERKQIEKRRAQSPKPYSPSKAPSDVTEIRFQKGSERGFYQLVGTYRFYQPRFQQYATKTGYSYATRHIKRGYELQICREEAIEVAKAKLENYNWIVTGIIEEHWIKW